MIEAGPVLETYRLEMPPENLSGQNSSAIKIFDHPLKFLTYEGSVNKGLGSVEIAETGSYQLLNKTDDSIELQLSGKFLKGRFSLAHIEADRWEFCRL